MDQRPSSPPHIGTSIARMTPAHNIGKRLEDDLRLLHLGETRKLITLVVDCGGRLQMFAPPTWPTLNQVGVLVEDHELPHEAVALLVRRRNKWAICALFDPPSHETLQHGEMAHRSACSLRQAASPPFQQLQGRPGAVQQVQHEARSAEDAAVGALEKSAERPPRAVASGSGRSAGGVAAMQCYRIRCLVGCAAVALCFLLERVWAAPVAGPALPGQGPVAGPPRPGPAGRPVP